MHAECHDADRFVAYVRGELFGPAATVFEHHVAGCCECAARLADEARVELALLQLGEAIHDEVELRSHWWSRVGAWWRERRAFAQLAPIAVATALAIVVCDPQAMRELVDPASPSSSSTLAQLDDDCDEGTRLSMSLAEGPMCAPQVEVSLALATFPPEEPSYGFTPADEPCPPDDGGDLVCESEEPHSG